MAGGRAVFASDRCKGCGLCAAACPAGILALDANVINSRGYHPAGCTDSSRCTGCASCALMCPDLVITVYRDVPDERRREVT